MAIKEFSLPGVKTFDLNMIPDERGFFSEAIREDWTEIVGEKIVQANMSFSYPDIVRAWHRHLRGQIDVFLVLDGSLKICAYDDVTKKLIEIVGNSKKPILVKIPGHYWHGFKTVAPGVGAGGALLMYFVNRLYDPKDPDEERRAWNDEKIVPAEINGNTKDPRVGKPWDWFYPAHK